MSDKQYQKLENEQTTVTIEDALGSPKRPVRGKTVRESSSEKETKKEPARQAKLNGKDVQEMFEKASKTFVFMGAQTFWYIPGDEVKAFSDDLADLLNRIPAHYVTGVFSLSGYLTVAFGLVSVFKPRIEMQREYAKLSKNGKVEEQQAQFQFTA